MIEFVFLHNNWMYSAALGLVIALFAIELLGLLVGLSIFSALDDFSLVNADSDAELGITPVLSWLCLDRLPLMIWLLLLLTLFGISGYVLNLIALKFTGATFAIPVSIPIALVVGLILTGRLGGMLSRRLPKNESTATYESDFEGLVAQVTLGTATRNSPAEAKCTDQFNQTHYLMVEPIEANESFAQHDKIILIKKADSAWLATRYVH